MPHSRKWLITINNPIEHGFDHARIKAAVLDLPSVLYWCMCDEQGDECETLHTHVYFVTRSVLEHSQVDARFPSFHRDIARGKSSENRAYVLKDGPKFNKQSDGSYSYKDTGGHLHEGINFSDTFEEGGEMPVEHQGKSRDADKIVELIKAGATNEDIVDAVASAYRDLEKVERVRSMYRDAQFKDSWRDLEVTYIFGKTGGGKTRSVMDKYGYANCYRVTDYKHPFDTYDGQDVIIFEEFRSGLKHGDMLNYLDGYPLLLPCRYFNRQACFTIITIICCVSIAFLCVVSPYADTMTVKEMTIEQISLCWQTSTSKKNVVSFDTLTSLCVDLNRAGYPCEVSRVSALNGYAIVGKGYVHNTYESSRVYALNGKYYSTIEGSIFYTPYQTDSLISSINTYVSSISSTVSTISSNISSMLSGVTGIGGKLDTVINLLTNTEYCCGYDTNSSGTAFPQQTISYSIAEQIVARLNTTMQGKTIKLLKRDGSGASNATFVRAYISDTNYIKIQVASGSALLCDSSNTIFKVGTNYLSSIYSRVNTMKTSLANAVTRLDSLLEDSGAILTAVKALPDYSAKFDTIADLLTSTEYCCGYDTNSSGTAFPQQTISYSIAEQIVARLNTTMQGKMVKLLKRDGSGASNAVFVRAYISDTNYIKIQVASGSALLCDSTNTIFKVGTDYVSGIYARLNSANTSLTSIDSRLSTLHTDNTGFVGIFNTMNNTLGDLNLKLGDLKTDLGGLEVNITGGSSGAADLSNVESALSTIIDKMDNLPASVDNIVVNITNDNDAYNVFYVEDENGDKKSVTSVAGDSLSASGKLLQFLYKLIIGSALTDVDNSIDGLNDFFFDNAPSGLGEGVTVWD